MKKKQKFIEKYLPLAEEAGSAFKLNPVVILAQAAIESGWGQSALAEECNNFFGITGYGSKSAYWDGKTTSISGFGLLFRIYADARQSFMDYARLIRRNYTRAADMSYFPEAFAKEMAYSPYISEVNGDDREAYRKTLASISRWIEEEGV
ncbi:MAG: glucosaminidase domain-containing protein [Bacteroidales bacterium]